MEMTRRRRSPVPKSARKEVTTRMLPELADALRQHAEHTGVTVNALIVALVEAELAGDAMTGDAITAQLREARADRARAEFRQALDAALDAALDEVLSPLFDGAEARSAS